MQREKAENIDAKNLQEIFISILSSELNDVELDGSIKNRLTMEVIPALFYLSKRHDLTHIVSASLYKNGIALEKEMQSKFSGEEIMSVYRYENIKYAYEQISEVFDKASIPYIPLKGSVLRPYYPKESMRTSCDIDILVKEESLYQAIEILTYKGFKCGEKSYHDVSLFSPNNIHLELHFNIQENIQTLDDILKDAWDYATPINGSCYELTKEFFLFHIFAHISYHFLSGGCGIRSLMDIWVMSNKMGIDYTQAENLLKKAGIYQFAEKITALVECCFSNKEMDKLSQELLTYIFNGGVYGTVDNNVAMNVSKKQTSLSYALKRIFIPFKDLAIEYPVLKKFPPFCVFCWFHRTTKLFFSFVKRVFTSKKAKKNLSDSKIDKLQKMKNQLGL